MAVNDPEIASPVSSYLIKIYNSLFKGFMEPPLFDVPHKPPHISLVDSRSKFRKILANEAEKERENDRLISTAPTAERAEDSKTKVSYRTCRRNVRSELPCSAQRNPGWHGE
uniref:Uncharacterized protein n=1 Tax=Schistocephalus solidus TaxID=70667 RepID=A0A0X3NYJ2_SCHSO